MSVLKILLKYLYKRTSDITQTNQNKSIKLTFQINCFQFFQFEFDLQKKNINLEKEEKISNSMKDFNYLIDNLPTKLLTINLNSICSIIVSKH